MKKETLKRWAKVIEYLAEHAPYNLEIIIISRQRMQITWAKNVVHRPYSLNVGLGMTDDGAIHPPEWQAMAVRACTEIQNSGTN
jgi:hypothetical protein